MTLEKDLREIARLFSQNALPQAKDRCETLIRQNPTSALGFRFLALIENRLGNQTPAHAAIAKALTFDPRDPVNLNIQGVVFVALGRLNDALAAFESAVAAHPTFVPALINRGKALLDLGRASEALACLDDVRKLAPSDASVFLRRGEALAALGRSAEALDDLARAVQMNPRSVETRLVRAEVLRVQGRASEALQAFDAALVVEPGNMLALQNSATLLHQAGQIDHALSRYERLAGLLRASGAFPEQLNYALGMAVSCRRTMCSWAGMTNLESELIASVRDGDAAIKPYLSLMMTDDPVVQALSARRTFDAWFGHPKPVSSKPRPSSERLRIGYVSGDFRDHPTSLLIAKLIETHDRNRFEVRAYSNGPDDRSALRERLGRAFDHFTDISQLSDDDAAAQIAGDGVDILVDLNGLTDFGRGGVFARRPAPIAVHFLGYPGPLGTRAIDYIIADCIVLPPELEKHFDSAIVRLPVSYQVNDRTRETPQSTPTRQAAGLPENGFVYCGFCQPIKLSPEVFDVWMRILKRVPDSVLWLLEDNHFLRPNLRHEASTRGVDPSRLIFAGRVGQSGHLARHQLADLVLDTWPCGAHTSASDALWLGVPVLTWPGATFASRVAASVLTAFGRSDLIVDSLEAYENRAVDIAGASAESLASAKSEIRAARVHSPLFDTDRFRSGLERAYREMAVRALRGQAAESFDIAD